MIVCPPTVNSGEHFGNNNKMKIIVPPMAMATIMAVEIRLQIQATTGHNTANVNISKSK
jgi:CheY-specific phosphatase CheX